MNLQLERLTSLCAPLKLEGMAINAPDLAQQAATEEWDYLTFFEQLLKSETQVRASRKQQMFTRLAGFPAFKTLEEFDYKFASGAPKAMIKQLSSLAFIERADRKSVRVGKEC